MAKKEAAQAPADGEAKPAGKMKLIIIIAIAVLLAVGLSAGGTWFFLSKKDDGAADKAKEEVAAEPAAPVKQAAIYEELAPAFVVNFNHQGRARYMQVSVALMTRDQVALDALKVHMPVLRNRLVMLFSSQDFASLISPVGKEMLRQQATASVQELAEKEVGKVTVEQVLFTNLVLQ
ncbi:flagellar basal body-associated protein FliL [Pseudomonas sp. HMWF032]|uniref:flagellar basal body-associated protein FliL n=1 Tax=Pseudomonas sp. HMWF032 TaxID=2056866 RepID=UPI000D380521|nr:flagellar basal body-associated protein FliL [Pseudomonas sp. HMWF032]PTS82743.1 flagellar basal body-associated protein FliL [Pseudomonas sp. HMWF032]PTT72834.1 flagellar basal body-associated protein FliL [Pseudomonas sp. HMWF010]